MKGFFIMLYCSYKRKNAPSLGAFLYLSVPVDRIGLCIVHILDRFAVS